MIPVLSIHQPYASLIVAGVKRWETRSWPCPAKYVGRRIAIAATAKRPKDYWHHVDRDPQFPETLAPFYDLGVYVDIDESSDGEWWRYRWAGPLGCIVGTVVVARSLPIARCSDTGPEHVCCPVGGGLLHHLPLSTRGRPRRDISDQQPYGHWKPGGWAWELTGPQLTTERCPWCDGRGFVKLGPMLRGGPLCPVCNGKGRCDPIPVKGRQRVWPWDGTRRPT